MRPDRETFWFGLAAQYATRATCPRASIGAVLVKFDRLIGAGFNGAPEGEPHCLEDGESLVAHVALEHCERARHAEINALRNALLPPFGATLYVVGPRPICAHCTDRLQEAGVTDMRHRPLSPLLDSTLHEVIAWQRQTFKGERLLPSAQHLLREVRELAVDPSSGEEHADALMLAACVLDQIRESAAARGIDLMAETVRKLAINRQRTWGQPDEAGVIEHVREVVR